MFHIRPRPSKRKDRKGKFKQRYQAIINIYKNGRKFYKAKTCASQREAEAWGREVLTGIDNGMITKESLKRRKLSDAITKYIDHILPTKPKNAKNVIQHLKWWDQQIGHMLLSEVLPPIIAEYRDRLLAGSTYKKTQRSSTTVVRYLASLSIVFETAIKEWMWITQNPVRQIRKPSVRKSHTRTFSLDEVAKIKNSCTKVDSPYLLPIFKIALGTTMRKSEILFLRWSRVCFENRLLVLYDSKNGEPRNIPMSDTIYKILFELAKKKGIGRDPLLFPSPSDPEKPISIRSAWERVLKLAEIQPKATFHTTRHTACSFLSAKGFLGITISKLSGHSDDSVTDRVYTHLVSESAREMVRTLDLMMNGAD